MFQRLKASPLLTLPMTVQFSIGQPIQPTFWTWLALLYPQHPVMVLQTTPQQFLRAVELRRGGWLPVLPMNVLTFQDSSQI